MAQVRNSQHSTSAAVHSVDDNKVARTNFVVFSPLAGFDFSKASLWQGWPVTTLQRMVHGQAQPYQVVVWGRMHKGLPVKGQSIVIPLRRTGGPTIVYEKVMHGSIVKDPATGQLEITGDQTDHVFVAVETGLKFLKGGGRQKHLQQLLEESDKGGKLLTPHRSFGMQPKTEIVQEVDESIHSESEFAAAVATLTDTSDEVVVPMEKLAEIEYRNQIPGLNCPASTVTLYDGPAQAGVRIQNLDDRRYRILHEGDTTRLADAIGPSHKEDWNFDFTKFLKERGAKGEGRFQRRTAGRDVDEMAFAENNRDRQ